mmetsp:Transcript_131/g.261  ORF Transcript_131/g.261 Transcript_131/m.261 type:complete len:213 (-) Transcript_131:891-1529(-)
MESASLRPSAPACLRSPSTIMDCRQGQPLSPSHCCPEALNDVATPPGLSRPESRSPRQAAAACASSAAQPHHSGAKLEAYTPRLLRAAVHTPPPLPLPSSSSSRSSHRPRSPSHMSAWMAARRRSAAASNSAAVPHSPSAAAMSAMLRSIWYRKALRSAGATRVVRMLCRFSPSSNHRDEKSHPDSAALAMSQYTFSAGRPAAACAVSTSSL